VLQINVFLKKIFFMPRINKKEKVYTIGLCKYCDELFDSSVPFVVFASKDKAHYECYKDHTNKEQKEKGVI